MAEEKAKESGSSVIKTGRAAERRSGEEARGRGAGERLRTGRGAAHAAHSMSKPWPACRGPGRDAGTSGDVRWRLLSAAAGRTGGREKLARARWSGQAGGPPWVATRWSGTAAAAPTGVGGAAQKMMAAAFTFFSTSPNSSANSLASSSLGASPLTGLGSTSMQLVGRLVSPAAPSSSLEGT